MFDYRDDVWGVVFVGVFGVVGVDCVVGKGGDGGFDEVGFVEGVGVDYVLDVYFVVDGKISVDGGWGGFLVFVEFEVVGVGGDLFFDCEGVWVVVFVCDVDVDGEGVGCLEYLFYVVCVGGVGCCVGVGVGKGGWVSDVVG